VAEAGPGAAAGIDPRLRAVLVEAQARGLVGAVPLDEQVAHSLGFAASFRASHPPGNAGGSDDLGAHRTPSRWLDLGSGGGLPGLALALTWPTSQAVLLDAGERRAAFLGEAVDVLGLRSRVDVVRARAEDAGRAPALRGSFDLVVARSFGPPPVTAECAAPFLQVGGLMIVSEPPDDVMAGVSRVPTAADGARVGGAPVTSPGRWPAAALAQLGLEPLYAFRTAFGYQVLRQVHLCPERYPRRAGIVAKRPLYREQER